MARSNKRREAPRRAEENEVKLEELVTIERLVPGGDGFARLADGRALFVSGALPGDQIQLESVESRGGYARATSFSLLSPSAERAPAPCPVAHECGGCDLMALNEESQGRYKLEILRQALRRTGGFSELPRELSLEQRERLGYRNRVRMRLRDGRLGFYARGSHRFVEIADCVVCSPELNAAIARVRALLSEHATTLSVFEELELRVFVGVKPTLCWWLAPKRRGLPPEVRALLQSLRAEFIVAVRRGQKLILGDERVQEVTLPNAVTLRLGPFDFSQVHWQINQAIIEQLLTGAERRGVKTFVDAYCGSGNFTLPLLKAGLKGHGVELNQDAIARAKQAAASQGLDPAAFVAMDAAVGLQRLFPSERSELLVLDPPRSGARQLIEALNESPPRWIFMCSCDPVTFARDLRMLVDRGYSLSEIAAYDMFPQTHHLEATAWLELAP